MSNPEEIRRKAAPRVVAAGFLVSGLSAGAMGALESWQRPFVFLPVGDTAWLLIMAGCLAAAAGVWPGGGWRGRIARASLCAILGMAVTWMPRTANRGHVVELLLGHEEILEIIAPDDPRLEENARAVSDAWSDMGRPLVDDLLDYLGIGNPWVAEYRPIRHAPDPYDHLLETCRWPTRFAFIRRILEDPTNARLATYHWHRLFPSVVGQDVTLAHRSELIDWLALHAGAEDTPSACRDAAVFWMALIVLTDVDAFEDWTDPAIEMMLSSNDPPMSASGDVWMRALDLLIALMPAERHEALSAPLVADPVLMRRALRQRMRGIHHHFEVIAREIQTSPCAPARWADMKRVADRLEDEQAAKEIHTWLAGTMAEWLAGDTYDALRNFRWNPGIIPEIEIPSCHRDLASHVPQAMQKTLSDRAHAALDEVERREEASSGGSIHRPFYHALVIAPFLAEETRAEIHRRAGLIISNRIPMLTEAKDQPRGSIREIAHVLEIILDDLDAETVGSVRGRVFKHFIIHQDGRARERAIWRVAVVLDAAAEEPLLSPVEWIALWNLGFPLFKDFPEVSPADVSEFFGMMEPHELPNGDYHILEHVGERANSRRFMYDQLLFRAMLHDMIVDEGLPVRSESKLGDLKNMRLDSRGPYYPPWPPHEHEARIMKRLLSSIKLDEFQRYHRFIEFLMDHPLRPGTRRVVVKHLFNRLDEIDPERSATAFHWLLQFSDWLEADERAAFRERFHRFFRTQRISIREWEERFIHYNSIEAYGKLMHRGEQVPWDDDALSAEFSWSSSIHHELAIMPWRAYSEPSVFRHLHASGTVFFDHGWFAPEFHFASRDAIESFRAYRADVPCPREVATPWQLARALHLRRPDLHFPDRPIFRPSGSRAHFKSRVERTRAW